MRKPRLQPKLASLSKADREQLADWIRHGEYDPVLARANKPRSEGGLGLNISKSVLQRFHAKVALLDAINAKLPTDKKISLALFETLAQRQIDYLTSAADNKTLAEAHQSILNTSCDLASTADSPTQLATLQRLVDFPVRAEIRANKEERAQAKELRDEEMHAHKIKMSELHHQLVERKTIVREKTLDFQREKEANRAAAENSKLSTKNSKLAQRPLPPGHYINEDGRLCDNLGPIAQNLQEINDRVRKQFGITPEESARRAELRKTWKNPNIPKYLRTNPQPSADAVPSTDAPIHISGGTTSGSPTSTSRDAANETNAAPADPQPPMKSQTSELQSLSTDEISSNPDALPTPTLNLNPNTSNASNCVSGSEYFAAALTSTPVAADVRRLTSSSRDAANETTATPADPKPLSSPLPAGERQGEGFRAHSNNAAPANQNAQNNPPQKQPSAPAPHSSPITHDLSATVDEYTIARMREHIAHEQKYTPWPHRHSPPTYVTQLRHCPCGNETPCPIHESKPFGPFPDFFWKITPTDPDYAAILEARNLPFRFPNEFIA